MVHSASTIFIVCNACKLIQL